MASIDSVVTQTETDLQGNTYTTNISNDSLSNEDFMRLLLEEMKQQDPTDPMDSKELMDSTIQMSTIQANTDMSTGMKELSETAANLKTMIDTNTLGLQNLSGSSSLNTAASLIGKVVEDGSSSDDGVTKRFMVNSAENINGQLYLDTKLITATKDGFYDTDSGDVLSYDADGNIFQNGDEQDYDVALDENGRFLFNDDGTIKILDSDGEEVTDDDILDNYTYTGAYYLFADNVSKISLSDVKKVG